MRKFQSSVAVLLVAGLSDFVWGQVTIFGGEVRPAAQPAPVKMPLIATAVDQAQAQTSALAMKLDVSHRLAYVSEVLSDLERRSGVRVAVATSLGQGQAITLEGKGLTVREALQKLADAGKLELDLRAEVAVLTRKADDGVLADLEKRLASPDRWERCNAVWGLGNLADPRIYPLLVKGLDDKDEGVIEWTLKALEKHSAMGCLLDDRQKLAVAAGVTDWFKAIEPAEETVITRMFGLGYPVGLYSWYPTPGGRTARLRSARLDLLGSTRQEGAIKLLTDALKGSKSMYIRGAAATALGENRIGANELLAAHNQLDAEMVEAQATVDKAREPGKPLVIQGELQKVFQKIQTGGMVKQAVMLALLKMRNPEMIARAQEWINGGQDPDRRLAIFMMSGIHSEFGYELNLSAMIKRDVANMAKLYEMPEKAPAPAGAGGAWGGGVMAVYNASNALSTLAGISDPAITAEMLKLAKNETVFNEVASRCEYDLRALLPVEDPEVVAALLARIRENGAGAKLAMRSLAQSHNPKVADALLQLLKDAAPEQVVAAGQALAKTRDARSLDALVSLLREKRDWPDWEAADQVALKAGKGVRPRSNPRRALVLALLETRDPRLFTELATLAQEKSAHPEIIHTARRCLRSAVMTVRDMDALVKMTTQADPATQLEILANAGADQGMWWYSMASMQASQQCIESARWAQLLTELAPNEESFMIHRGAKQKNYVVDALAAIQSPVALEMLLRLCNPNLGEDLSRLSRVAIEGFGDGVAVLESLK